MDKSDSDDSGMEDCKCISCQATEVRIRQNNAGYEDELRRIILTGRNKEPFPDWDMVSGFFDDCFKPLFRGPNLYSCYRLMTNNYNRHHWLTGCPAFTNFFCFSCSLFGMGEDDAFFLLGETDLPDITTIAAKHSLTAGHVKYVQKWLSYDQPADFRHLDEQEKKRIFVHDEIVRRRRAVACFVMIAILVLSTQGLSFREGGRNDWQQPLYPGPLMKGKFFEILARLRQETENKEVTIDLKFSIRDWLTLDVQTKFINAVAEVIRMNIKSNMEKAEYVSIIVDKPLSIGNVHHLQTSTILRFVDNKGVIHETFVGLYIVQQDSLSLLSHICEVVESFSLKQKLVAVACGGGSILSTQLVDFQSKLLESYPRARFVPCCSHMIDNLVYQSLGYEMKPTSSFSRLVTMISDLFRDNEARQKDVRKFVSQRCRIQQPLDFDRKLIQTLNCYRNQFIDYFIAIPNQTHLYNDERANGMLDDICKLMKEVKSAFYLKLLSKIFLLLEPLNDSISSIGVDVASCAEQVEKCLVALKELRTHGFNAMWSFVNAAAKEGSSQDLNSIYMNCFNDILDNTIDHVTARFGYLVSTDFISLLDPKRFSAFCIDFPEDAFKSLSNQYMFKPQLREELGILYKNRKVYKKSISQLLLNFGDLQCEPLPEVQKLVYLIRALPLSPVSSEISKYKKVEKYVRLSKSIDLKESLPDLSLIYLEAESHLDLEAKTVESRMTIDKIIDLFAEKTNKKEMYAYINP